MIRPVSGRIRVLRNVQSITEFASPPRIAAWPQVDVVLLDMDGTLLDLRFDNHFWLEAVPQRYAERRGLSLERANEILVPLFAAKRGTLDWYCTDYWSRELGIDIPAFKEELREHVKFLPGAQDFLRTLQVSGLRAVLVTNAHHDALRVKAAQTGLLDYLDGAISSHRYGAPKEHPAFWSKVEAELGFDRRRTLFVDDSLPVLRAARDHGIEHIVAVAHPDSTQTQADSNQADLTPGRRIVEEFASVRAVIELLALPNAPRMARA